MTPAARDLVVIGRVVKPQGRKGEVLAQNLSDLPQRFPSLRKAFLCGPEGTARPVTVTSCWPHKGRFVLKFEGVDSIDDAEKLRGAEIRIGEDELLPLPAGSYYHHQIRGLRALDPSGRELGVVSDLLETGASPVLVVRGVEGECLIPFAAAFVRSVDLAQGVIVASVPELV